MKATSISFEREYSDGSGVEFGVRLVGGQLEFEHIHKIMFPTEELDWLLTALCRIKSELRTKASE